jgi:hypothetical protein
MSRVSSSADAGDESLTVADPADECQAAIARLMGGGAVMPMTDLSKGVMDSFL